jgi:AcrR family transcriptional regulator
MDEIASAAGVGIGTLYRHFPTKDDLLAALVAEQMEELTRAIGDPAHSTAWDRLTRVLEQFAQMQSNDRSLADVAGFNAREHPLARASFDAFGSALCGLMTRARDEGALRPDVGPDDVMRLFCNRHLAEQPHAWEIYARVVIDGLRRPA